MSTTEVKERPIILSDEMVRAILEGRKTQTRVVIEPQPEFMPGDENREFCLSHDGYLRRTVSGLQGFPGCR